MCLRSRLLVGLLMAVLQLYTIPAQAGQDLIVDGVPTWIMPTPFQQGEELMVPLRVMAETLGASVYWDGEDQSIHGSRQGDSFVVRLGDRAALINGRQLMLPIPTQLVEQQTYVPASFLLAALDAQWARDGSTIWISSGDRLGRRQKFSLALEPDLKLLGQPTIGQGEFFSVYLGNIDPGDVVTLETDLPYDARFYPWGSGRLLLQPVDCAQAPGTYWLKIKVARGEDIYMRAQQVVQVLPRSFPTQHLYVSAQTEAQRSADLWALDEPFWQQGLAHSAAYPLWTGSFIRPAPGRITTEFGSIRTVNQSAPSRHSGWDIAAAAGEPVLAAQDGVVSLAIPLHVTGNTVFIDHGCQLFSMYYHLDRILVQSGQAVKAGDVIGRVGSTGFSTGPHLHWALQLNGVYVEPGLFLDADTAPLAIP